MFMCVPFNNLIRLGIQGMSTGMMMTMELVQALDPRWVLIHI